MIEECRISDPHFLDIYFNEAVSLYRYCNEAVNMIGLFLLLAILVSWFCWQKYLVYSKFSNHFWLDWNLISSVLFGKKNDINVLCGERFNDLSRKHVSEGMFVIWAPQPVLFIFDEDQIKFFSNEPSFTDKPRFYKLFSFLEETVLFRSSGEHYKKAKQVMKPTFYPNVFKNFVPIMNHHARLLVQTLDETNGVVTDQTEEFLKDNILRIFLESSIGVKTDTEEMNVKVKRIIYIFKKLLQITTQRIVQPWMHSDFILKFTSVGRENFILKEELDSIIQQVLKSIKEKILLEKAFKNPGGMDSSSSHSREKCFGEILIEQHLKDPSFDMEAVANNIIGILIGGYGTTSNTLMWCLWLLGHHQDIQQKGFEEVMTITNGDIQYEDTHNLTYLECILKETLRLYPPAPKYGRISSKDVEFGEYMIPKGTTIAFDLYNLHRNPKLHSNPEDFIPERFANGKCNVRPWTYIPFAEGLRSCVGKQYAMMEMKIILAHVLRTFKILSLDQPEDVTLSFEILLRSAKPLRMQFCRR